MWMWVWMTTPSGANPNWENIIQRWKSSEIMETKKDTTNNHGVFALAFSLSLSLSLSLSPTYIVFAPSLLYTYHATS